MRAFLLVLLLAVAASAQVPTRVVIYKGTGTVPLPPNRLTYSAHPHAYFVHQVVGSGRYDNALILYYTTGVGKRSMTIDLTNYYMLDLREAATPTRTVNALSFWNVLNDANNTGLQSFYARGDLKPIVIATGDGAGSFAKSLACAFRDTVYNTPGNVTTITELNFNLAFDSKHTLAGNSGAKDFSTIISDLQTELLNEGYQ